MASSFYYGTTRPSEPDGNYDIKRPLEFSEAKFCVYNVKLIKATVCCEVNR